MKHDKDLMRLIMICIGKHDVDGFRKDPRLSTYSNLLISHHIHLLGEKGLLVTKLSRSGFIGQPAEMYTADRVTDKGWEYIDDISNGAND